MATKRTSSSTPLRTARAWLAATSRLARPKRAPREGDWLAEQRERGETFAQYRERGAAPQPLARRALYLQPVGELRSAQRGVARLLHRALSLFFGYPVRWLPAWDPRVLPAKARRTHPALGHLQLRTGYALERLARERPRDAVAVLALTEEDLWPGGSWSFVFGEAWLTERVGLTSLHRLGRASKRQRRRALATALHETGHLLGFDHCVAFECGMNGRNSLEETDRTPLLFCPECEAKVLYACRLSPAPRLRALAAFARRHGFQREALQWERCLAALRSAAPSKR